MCNLASQGGRCLGCRSRQAVRWMEEAYAQSPSDGNRAALVEAHAMRAATPAGARQARRALAEGRPGPGDLPSSYWQTIIDKGQARAGRDRALAQAALEHARARARTRARAAAQDRAEVLARAEREAEVARGQVMGAGSHSPETDTRADERARAAADEACVRVLSRSLYEHPYLWPEFVRRGGTGVTFEQITNGHRQLTGRVWTAEDTEAMWECDIADRFDLARP